MKLIRDNIKPKESTMYTRDKKIIRGVSFGEDSNVKRSISGTLSRQKHQRSNSDSSFFKKNAVQLPKTTNLIENLAEDRKTLDKIKRRNRLSREFSGRIKIQSAQSSPASSPILRRKF